MTKQEPPIDWSVTRGEDLFFAYRMAEGIGIPVKEIPSEEQYYFQGFETDMENEKKRWLRVASLYPETIDYVEFYRQDTHVYTCYDEPFTLWFQWNWKQEGTHIENNETWKAIVYLRDGNVLELKNPNR